MRTLSLPSSLSLISRSLLSHLVSHNHQEETQLRGSMSNVFEHHSGNRVDPADPIVNGTPHSTSPCKSIIAIGGTRELSDYNDKDAYHTDETFVCELDDGIDVPIEATEQQIEELRSLLNSGELISAESTIDVEGGDSAAMIGDEEEYGGPPELPASVVLPPGKIVLRQTTGDTQRTRNLATYEGKKPVLIVRVTDKNGLAVSDNAETVSDKFFGTKGDTATMFSQFSACSFNQMEISWMHSSSIEKELSAPGVLEVNIPVSLVGTSQSTIRSAMKNAVRDKLGFSLPGPFHHVLFVIEKCYEGCGWAAYAYVNSWMSVYQGSYYKYPGVQLHEIGHNLNLAHSGGLDSKTYTDHTCLMGNPLYSDDIAKMCFNPAKNYQIAAKNGWYDGYTTSWNTSSSPIWSGRLIGVAEYDNNPEGHNVVVKLVTGDSKNYYVGFNRATGINADNKQADNDVTIIEAGDGSGYAQSYLKATLREGALYTFHNWRATGGNLVVEVNEINTSTTPGYADVTMTFEPQSTAPSRQPTSRPTDVPKTARPSRSPVTPAPSKKPTSSPVTPAPVTYSPTAKPTSKPVTFSPTSTSPTKTTSSAPTNAKTSSPSASDETTKSPQASTSGGGIESEAPTRAATVSPSKRHSLSPVTSAPTTSPSKRPVTSSPVTSSPVPNPTGRPTAVGSDAKLYTTPNMSKLNGSAKGLMFTVKAKKDITITGFDIVAQKNAASSVLIYTRPGDYSGKEQTANGWELLFSGTENLKKTKISNMDDLMSDVRMSAGSTHSFYIYAKKGMKISKSNSKGNTYASDSSLSLTTGTTTKKVFKSVQGFGEFSGIIRYYNN
eukprot:scaffold1332_cov197-Alexandrium_tamarense.AAC.30